MRTLIRAGALVMLAGCGKEQTPDMIAANDAVMDAPESVNADGVNIDRTDDSSIPANVVGPINATDNVSRFTRYDPKACKLIEQSDEGPYFRYRCRGTGGFSYELTESDLRQSLLIVAPNGRRDQLDPGRAVGGGGFSTIGETFDWRGPAGQRPRTLTLRFNIAESHDPKAPPASYLMVVRLAEPSCIVATIRPGPNQSDEARAIADRDSLPGCLSR